MDTNLESAPTPLPEPASASTAPKRAALWGMSRSLLIILAGVFCIRTFIGEATMIPTGSMEDTILIGDHVFLDKLLYGPQVPYTTWRLPRIRKVHRGDIIAFRYPVNPSQLFVKRAIAIGGDTVRIMNGQVYLNGKLLVEPYVVHESSVVPPLCLNFPPTVREIGDYPDSVELNSVWAREMPRYFRSGGLYVPKGYVFAMGDNRDNSLDSRFWGFVPLRNIVGEPLFVYWSYNAPSDDWLDRSFGGQLRFDGSILLNFIQKTRWSRIGKVLMSQE
jgi:signal peptidase I